MYSRRINLQDLKFHKMDLIYQFVMGQFWPLFIKYAKDKYAKEYVILVF